MSDGIVAFLKARLAEDEAYLNSNRQHLWTQRPLREVEAKRALVQEVFWYEQKIDGEWACCHSAGGIAAGNCPVTPPGDIRALRVLAAVYSDHPDYDPEWVPEPEPEPSWFL